MQWVVRTGDGFPPLRGSAVEYARVVKAGAEGGATGAAAGAAATGAKTGAGTADRTGTAGPGAGGGGYSERRRRRGSCNTTSQPGRAIGNLGTGTRDRGHREGCEDRNAGGIGNEGQTKSTRFGSDGQCSAGICTNELESDQVHTAKSAEGRETSNHVGG